VDPLELTGVEHGTKLVKVVYCVVMKVEAGPVTGDGAGVVVGGMTGFVIVHGQSVIVSVVAEVTV